MAKQKKTPVRKKAAKKVIRKKSFAPKKKSAKKIAKGAIKDKKKTTAKTKKKAPAKRKSNGSVDLECFLSTACAKHLQLGDQCMELQTLRSFRDGYMMSKTEGRALVKEYYRTAPEIVKSIEADTNNQETYAYIYSEINLACKHILNNRLLRAQHVYETMVNNLKRKYLKD